MTDSMQLDSWTSGPGAWSDAGEARGQPANRLLGMLPEALRASIGSTARTREFATGQMLREPGRPLHSLYFVRSGLVSIVGGEVDQPHVEVASVGNEGMIGVSNILGSPSAEHAATALSPCVVDAIEAPVFGMLMNEHAELRQVATTYANERMGQVIRLSVCNARHRLEQRLARWILTAHARLGPGRIVVTHRDLAELLGVRRASVTESMHLLEGHGAIRSHRGYVSVRDLDRLTELSCGCHHLGGTHN